MLVVFSMVMDDSFTATQKVCSTVSVSTVSGSTTNVSTGVSSVIVTSRTWNSYDTEAVSARTNTW